MFFHAISTLIWVRELKVPSPETILALPHSCCVIQLKTISTQGKFCSDRSLSLSLPLLQLYQKTKWNMHKVWSIISFLFQKTNQKLPVSKESTALILLRNHSNTLQWGLLQLASQPIPHHFRVGKSATDIITDTRRAELTSQHNLLLSFSPRVRVTSL